MIDYSKYKFITEQDYEAVAGPDWPPFSVFITHESIPECVYNEIDLMLTPPVEFDHPSFCILPFYGYEYPNKTPCCLMIGGINRYQVQQEMLNGQKPSACQKCWNLENAGLISDRLIKNSTFNFYYQKNINDIFQECQQGKSSIIHYKIDTNNVCNLTCTTCNSNSSSAWAKLELLNNKTPAPTWQITPEEIDLEINYSTAISINFRGGEPFMSRTNWYILEKLIEHNNTNCFISFTTNGSFKLTKKQQEIIRKFNNINFCFSIDGIGTVFEYLRYPLGFDTIQNNISWCRDNGIDNISVSYTLSNLNILYHSQTIKWFEQNNLKYIINPVSNPPCFRPGALPNSVKKYIIENNSIDVSTFLNQTESDEIFYQQFKNNISQQDRWKNIQLKNYLPELHSLLDQ